jgi:cytochrome c oxidase subunit 2
MFHKEGGMTLQDEIWAITLVGLALVALVFVYVVGQAGKTAADPAAVQTRAYALRGWLFLALLGLGIGVTYATLAQFPIPEQDGRTLAPQIVKAVGHQWMWELNTAQVKAGVPVEFEVTSADVNHGFAVYDATGRLVAQTQAMPGFTNHLVHTFAPGKYRVLCLEYCGLAHHGMMTEFEVIGDTKGERT